MANNGNILYTKLKKVTDDELELPLDINNNLISVSGLQQDTKYNLSDDPDYIPSESDVSSCPLNIYSNEAVFSRLQKQCSSPSIGTWEIYSIPAGTYTSTISQADANNQALNDLASNAQNYVNSIGTCILNVYTFTRSDCFYKNNCPSDFPSKSCVIYTKEYVSNISQQDAENLANDDYSNFISEGQNNANTNGVCDGLITEINVEEVTGNPCSGTRTSTILWLNNYTSTYYANSSMTILANGIYWLEGQVDGRYLVIENGKIISGINDFCYTTGTIRWKDLGRPNSISRYGNNVLAAYASYNIVVKYDTSTGTNPVGTIVAGEIYKYDTGVSGTQNNYLNAPTLVKWRDDGTRFIVYSGGFYKSLKIFNSTGTFITKLQDVTSQDPNGNFDYKTPPSGKYASDPANYNGIFGSATPLNGENLDDYWEPQKIEYSLSEYGREVVLLGTWNKKSNGENRYRIHLILPYVGYFGYMHSYTLLYENYNYFDDGYDMVCDFAITRKQIGDVTKQATKYEVAFVLPRTYANENKYRNYRVIEIGFTHIDYNGVSWFENPYTRDMGHFRNVFGTGKTDWRENVRVDCNYTNGNLYVLIKSFGVSKTDYTKAWIRAGASGAAVGAALSFFAVGVATGLPSLGTLLTISSSLSITGAGAIIGVAILATAALVTWLLKPAKRAGTGTSRLSLNFSSSTTYHYDGGKAAPDIDPGVYQWIPSSSEYGINTYMDSNRLGNDTIYCLTDKRVLAGTFISDNYNSIVLEEVIIVEE